METYEELRELLYECPKKDKLDDTDKLDWQRFSSWIKEEKGKIATKDMLPRKSVDSKNGKKKQLGPVLAICEEYPKDFSHEGPVLVFLKP